MQVVQILVWIFYAYLAIGLLFGIWFVFGGIKQLDKGINGTSWRMRLILLPGTIGLWPVMLKKLLGTSKQKNDASTLTQNLSK